MLVKRDLCLQVAFLVLPIEFFFLSLSMANEGKLVVKAVTNEELDTAAREVLASRAKLELLNRSVASAQHSLSLIINQQSKAFERINEHLEKVILMLYF